MGIVPRELAKKYNLDVKVIQDKIGRDKWAPQKAQIRMKAQENVQEKINALTDKSLRTLEEIIDNEEAKHSDKIQAAKAILDVSGLKTQKQEITGANGEPLGVIKEYILPEEIKEIENHVNGVLGEP